MTAIGEALVASGLRHLFGVTGSGLTLRLATAVDHAGATYWPVRHEAAGALMAGAAAQVAQVPAASMSIKGPGFANMLAGIVANRFEARPALSFSEAYEDAAPRSWQHKRLDQRGLADFAAKEHLTLGDVNEVGGVEGALALAQGEAPGPVHIDLVSSPPPVAGIVHPREAVSRQEVGDCLDAIRVARSPVVIVGSLAARRAWGSRLSELTVPVFTTVAAKGVLDESGPFAAGVFTRAGRELAPESSVLASADLIVGLGLRDAELLPSDWPHGPVVALDEIGLDRGATFGSASPALANAGEFAQALDLLGARRWGEELVASARSRLRDHLLSQPWLPAHAFAFIDGLPLAHSLVLDTGTFCTVGEHLWTASPTRRFLGSSNGRFMGTALPTAIGVAVSSATPTVCVLGDGGLPPFMAELVMVAEHSLQICVVMMSDGRYGSVAAAAAPELSRAALTVPAPPWCRVAEAMGIEAFEVKSAEDFASAMGSWDGRPRFIEARFDSGQYERMTEAVRG